METLAPADWLLLVITGIATIAVAVYIKRDEQRSIAEHQRLQAVWDAWLDRHDTAGRE